MTARGHRGGETTTTAMPRGRRNVPIPHREFATDGMARGGDEVTAPTVAGGRNTGSEQPS